MRTQIDHDSKGYRARLIWDDGTQCNSPHFEAKLQAESWLAQTVASQRNHIYREPAKTGQKVAAAMMAIALIIPSLPALADEPLKDPGGRGSGRVVKVLVVNQAFDPGPVGGPVVTGSAGTR